jgi:hypothetical protein
MYQLYLRTDLRKGECTTGIFVLSLPASFSAGISTTVTILNISIAVEASSILTKKKNERIMTNSIFYFTTCDEYLHPQFFTDSTKEPFKCDQVSMLRPNICKPPSLSSFTE